MNSDLVSYYRDRAKEYELIYSKPERQQSLIQAAGVLQDIFKGKDVLEIACGTGYWTERIAKTATSVLAADINETVVEIARAKDYGQSPVSFMTEDIYQMLGADRFDALFGGFIWSHIPLEGLKRFIEKINSLVKPGGTIVLMDNNYVEGSNTPVAETDAAGNTWQIRSLQDGSEHRVLKNFPTEAFLRKQIEGPADDIQYYDLGYYWITSYRLELKHGLSISLRTAL